MFVNLMGGIMRVLMTLGALTGLLIAGNVAAAEMPALAKRSNCTACHAMDRKMAGPSWMDVARKYKGDQEAEAKLIAKVKKGGGGVWGSMAMPPQPAVKDADVKELVKSILALDK